MPNAARTVKHIVLEIAGSSPIKVSGGMDKDVVLDLLTENIKPVLMGIIQEEIFGWCH